MNSSHELEVCGVKQAPNIASVVLLRKINSSQLNRFTSFIHNNSTITIRLNPLVVAQEWMEFLWYSWRGKNLYWLFFFSSIVNVGRFIFGTSIKT